METAIEIRDLHKKYKSNHAVKGVTFSVQQGEIFGILGPNGAGKTTTLEILEGLRKPSSGEVRVLGLNPQTKGRELRERIGIQFQSTSIQERMRVGEALQLFSSLYHKRGNVERLVETLGLKSYLNTSFKDLSGGWKQRLTLALAALHGPEILFLDEPSTGLDPQARREIWKLINQFREEGMTVVLTTHYMEEAEKLCDRVAMFQKGMIAALDTPKRLVAAFTSAHYVSFESAQADPVLLRALTGVERVETEGETVRVYTPTLQETSLELFLLAKERQWTIGAFQFEVGTLDDLFVNLAEEVQSA